MILDSRIERLCAAFIAVCAAIVSLSTIVMTARALRPLPLYDDWGFLDTSDFWHQLLVPHSEHRIVMTKLAFLADMRLFHGSHLAFFLLTTFFLLSLGLVYWMLANLSPVVTPARRTIAASIVICLGISPLTADVFLWAMHLQTVTVNFLAPLSFGLLALCWTEEDSSTVRHYALLFAALGSAALATLSAANGAPAPLFLLAQAIVMRFRKWDMAILTIGAAAVEAIFLRGNTAQGNALATVLSAPWHAIDFFFLSLGSLVVQAFTFSDAMQYQTVTFLIGMGSFVLFAANTIAFARRYRRGSREGFALFSVVCGFFFLSGAALVALGRLPLGMSFAYTAHYNMLRVCYWANLIVSIPACWGTSRSWQVAGALALCGSLMMARALPIRAHRIADRALSLNVSSAAVMAAVFDPAAWGRNNLWEDMDAAHEGFAALQVASLRQRRLSLFYEPPGQWLGLNTKALSTLDHSCAGSILTTRSAADRHGPYTVVAGWVRSKSRSDKLPQLLLANQYGVITGYGAIRARHAVDAWTGYSRSAEAPTEAYILEDGRLCLLAGTPGPQSAGRSN